MPTDCLVCAHQDARNIDIALLAGDGVRSVARRYGLDKSTVSRHMRLHLKPRLTAAETAAPARIQRMENHQAHLDVMRAMRDLHARTLALLDKAESSGDLSTALRAVREARGNLELLGRLDGSLDGPVATTSGPVQITVQYVDRQLVLPSAPALLGDGEGD
jgi:hypothetical protein